MYCTYRFEVQKAYSLFFKVYYNRFLNNYNSFQEKLIDLIYVKRVSQKKSFICSGGKWREHVRLRFAFFRSSSRRYFYVATNSLTPGIKLIISMKSYQTKLIRVDCQIVSPWNGYYLLRTNVRHDIIHLILVSKYKGGGNNVPDLCCIIHDQQSMGSIFFVHTVHDMNATFLKQPINIEKLTIEYISHKFC